MVHFTSYQESFLLTDYWNRLCGMEIYSKDEKSAILGYSHEQVKLEFNSGKKQAQRPQKPQIYQYFIILFKVICELYYSV